MADNPSQHARGMAVRREVLGDTHVDRAIANTTDFTERFQDYITRCAWGELWAADGIDRSTRSMITLAVLAATGCEDEFALHVRASQRIGLRPEQIREVLMHVAIYAGVPRANSAFAIANRILGEDSGGAEPTT